MADNEAKKEENYDDASWQYLYLLNYCTFNFNTAGVYSKIVSCKLVYRQLSMPLQKAQ